jgi:NADH dehydrogenase
MKRIVIVGGGVAGLLLATRLAHALGRRGTASISLVDRSPTHVWKPMLHTFAAGTWSSYQQQVQLLAHARIHAFNYVPGQLCGLDPQRQCIRLSPMRLGDETIIGESAPTPTLYLSLPVP